MKISLFLSFLLFFLSGILCAGASPASEEGDAVFGRLPLEAQKEVGRAYAAPTLGVDYWARKYAGAPLDARKWSDAWHKGIYGSWFNGKDEKVAKGYITTWGPLGIRTYMHDQTWNAETAFLARAPEILKDSHGELFTNAFEVIDVLPGSPAEGYLRVGDLLVAMEGEGFSSASKVKKNPPYKHQNARSLALHAGLLLDRAEGRGEVTVKILREAAPVKAPSGEWKLVAEQAFSHHGNKAPHHFEEKVKGGFELRLQVTDGGNGNGGDGFSWENVYLKRGDKSVPLYEVEVERSRVGYGRLVLNKERSGWEAHAHSEIDVMIPPGDWLLVADARPRGGATVKARILARRKPTVPKALLDQVRTVSFPIVKMGSFQKGFPGSCVKTANIIAQQSAWLASQQMSDGSWQRPRGYTSNHYDTAWAGLGLMATGDSTFDSHIRKAAHFLAFEAKTDGWAVPASVVVVFLSEYWIRSHDDAILPGLRAWVDCIETEYLTGDYTVGHGHNPGYRGTGVSTGGSHVSAALAMAEKTPVGIEQEMLDRMLYRVQELAPDGFVPYGRGRGEAEFTPALDGAGTYSGRHGPYLVASLLHGGPRLFTENCTAIYRDGPKGGCDQGHATETLSTQWAFIAMAAADLKAYREHLEALRWKISMRRCFNGGFCQSAFRLEYAGGEGLLDYAIRSGSWLVALCAEKQNLAITGAPRFRTKQLVDLPPTQHVDAMLHGYYLRNWGVVDAVLGDQSPPVLRGALKSLRQMNGGEGLRQSMRQFLTTQAMVVSREVVGIKGLPPQQRGYLVEMLLGVDHRIDALADEKTPGPDDYRITITSQHPMAGFGMDAGMLDTLGMGMHGSVTIQQGENLSAVPGIIQLDSNGKVNWKNWHTGVAACLVTAKQTGAFQTVANFRYKVGDLEIDYTRPILFNQGEEWGNGEKQRKVINDRRVWVPGRLPRDQARWNASFLLPGGQFVAAATQGNDIMVRDPLGDWVSPRDRTLQAGSIGEFCFTSGWQRYECRVPEFRLKSVPPLVAVASIRPLGGGIWKDEDAAELVAGEACTLSLDGVESLELRLARATPLRAMDFRADKIEGIVVEARVGDVWQIIHLGRPSGLVKELAPVTTEQLRITLRKGKKGAKGGSLKLLRLYQ